MGRSGFSKFEFQLWNLTPNPEFANGYGMKKQKANADMRLYRGNCDE